MIYAIALSLSMICDPLLGALFTPPRPELGRYEVCTTSAELESAAADTGTGGQDVRIEALEALEAFGAAGPYNRAALARLYGGTRVRVVRRWQQRGNQFISETLLSPYPDATLTRLNSGTMVIRFTLDRVQREDPAFARQTRQSDGGQAVVQRAKAGGL